MRCSSRYPPARSDARPPPRQSVMSKKSVNRSRMSQGATAETSPTFSTPTIHTVHAKAAEVKSTVVAPSARPPVPPVPARSREGLVENASASIKRSAPIPTTRSGERARAMFMSVTLAGGHRGLRLRLCFDAALDRGRDRGRARLLHARRREPDRPLVVPRGGVHHDSAVEVVLNAGGSVF